MQQNPMETAGISRTGVIARAMHVFATTNAEQVLELGKMAAITELEVEAQHG